VGRQKNLLYSHQGVFLVYDLQSQEIRRKVEEEVAGVRGI